MSENLIREIVVDPAFDRRDRDPSKDYGVHGCNMRFHVKGEKGVVQFVIYTNWHLPHIHKSIVSRCQGGKSGYKGYEYCRLAPLPADIGYHSPTPIYEGQEICQESCSLLGGKPCYYDGSSLNAEEYFNVLVSKGSDALWEKLENYYHRVFNKNDQE